MLNVVMLNAVMLNVVTLSVVMLNVVEPTKNANLTQVYYAFGTNIITKKLLTQKCFFSGNDLAFLQPYRLLSSPI
jgi:hypothetical protein